MACIVRACSGNTHKKALMCPAHWHKIPVNIQMDVRKGTEKGNHTLRATPTREWIQNVEKYVGDVRNLNVFVDATSKVKRKFQGQQSE